ncbi:MAG: hypothetical protein COB15_02375 [Flavobacteriales bacterium]|nr:MAG: hypothetical protein COB15_02375 [Flavobacteriales bacterium]
MSRLKLGYWLPIFIIGVFLFSCKVQEKENVKIKIKIKHRSSKFLIKKLKEKEFNFKTISSKAAVSVIDNANKKTSFKVHLRIRKDSIIWMSISKLGIEAARVIITTDSLKLIDRFKKEYFLGDFKYINKLFGTDLDYQMLEALLMGNSLDFDEDEKIHSRVDRKKELYFLSTEKKRKVKKEIKKEKEKIKKEAQVLWLDPISFKIKELLLSSPETNRSLSGVYSDYKILETQLIPDKIRFELKSNSTTTIEIDYSKFSSGKSLTFPFKISSKYVEIKK